MISFFRHHLQGRFLRTIVYAVSLLMVLPYSFTLFFKWFSNDDWAIKVDGTAISLNEYNARVDEISDQIEQLKKMFGPQAENIFRMQGMSTDPQKIALDALTTQALVDNIAHRMYLVVSPEFVRQQVIASLPKELRRPDGTVDEAMIAQYLRKSFAQLEQQKAEQILEGTLMELAMGSAYVPEFVLKDRFMREFADRRCTCAFIPLKSFVAHEQGKDISDAQLKTFFDAQNRASKRYFVPEKRAGIVWVFDADKYGVRVGEKQITAYYNRNKYQEFVDQTARLQVRHILLAFNEKDKSNIRTQAHALLQELKTKPELFEQKARELSADITTKKSGGLIEFVPKQGNNPFEQAAMRLTKDGDISPVLETPQGFEIIQRVAKKSPTYKPLERVRAEIERKLRQQQFERTFGYEIKYTLARAQDKEQMLAEFARKKNAVKKELAGTVLTQDPLVQKLFNARRDTGSFVVDGDKGYAIIVTDLKKTYQPPFDTVKDRVRQDLCEQRALETLTHVLDKVRIAHTKKIFDEVAQQYGAKVQAPVWVRKNDTKALQNFEQQAGQSLMQKLFAINKAGAIVTGMHGQNGVMIFVDELAPFDQKLFDAKKAALLGTLVQETRGLVEQSFVASLYKNATIKINEKIAK